MINLENAGLWIFSLIASGVTFVSGYIDEAIIILLCFMVIDITTGVLRGFKAKRLKSAITHLGIIKKASTLLAIIFAILLDRLLNDGMPVFETLMVWLAIGSEGLSIIENFASLGVKLPKQFKERLAQVVQENEDMKKGEDK